MSFFNVQYARADGSLGTITLEADTLHEAKARAGIPASRLLSVREDKLGSLKASFSGPRLTQVEQITMLGSLAAQVSSGQPSGAALLHKVSRIPKLEPYKEALLKMTTTSDRLKMLRFDPNAVLLVKIGEDSGNHAEALDNAKNYLKRMREMSNMIRGPMIMNAVLFSLATIMFTAVPLLGDYIMSEAQSSGMPIKANIATRFLLMNAFVMKTGWPYLIALITGLFMFRGQLWPTLKTFPIIRLVEDIVCTMRAMRFVSAYTPLFRAGVVSDTAIENILKSSSAADSIVYKDMLADIRRGGSFGHSFKAEHWPADFIDLMEAFDGSSPGSRRDLLILARELMDENLRTAFEKLSAGVKVLAMSFMLLAIVCLVYGIFVPVTTIRPQV